MPSNNTFLWRLTGDLSVGDSYLFGTMHVRDQMAFSQLELVKEKISSCDAFALEFDLSDPAAKMGILSYRPNGYNDLCELISVKKYDKLRGIIFKASGLDISHFRAVPPFLLIGLITEQLLGKEMPLALDHHLWEFAEKEEKNLLGIETFQEQLEVLRKIPIQTQLKMLLDLGSNISKVRRSTLHLAELYKNGDLTRLSKSVRKGAKGLRKLLLYKRNEIMAARIMKMVQDATVFAAVGAGHLGGGKGVLRLLKKQGLKVTPVFQSDN